MLKLRVPKRWISLMLAVALMVTLMPVFPASAAVAFTFDGYSTDVNSPTQVNSGTIDVKGTYFGVAADSITYKVEWLVNGKVEGTKNGTGVSPILSGTNGFTFHNVQLFAGLNRVTVSGNASGSIQSNSFYVYYPNVPTIYDIELTDGRELLANKPTLVTTDTISLMFRAPNATSVTVQGKTAFSGGGDLFLVSGINVSEGLNKLVFVASNTTMSYSVTRDVVRLYGLGTTAYDISIDNSSGTPTSVKLDGNPTVGSNLPADTLSGKISGKIALPVDPTNPTPNVTIEVRRQNNGNPLPIAWSGGGNVHTIPSANLVKTEELTVTGATYDYAIYKFTTSETITITNSDQYNVILDGDYGSRDIDFGLVFNYRKNTDPYITEVKQLYNVTKTGSGAYSYTSSSLFTDGLSFFQPPIWIGLKVNNFASGHSIMIDTTQDGVTLGSPSVTYELGTSTNGEQVIKITNLPAGEQTLNIRVLDGSTERDVQQFDITYVPTPFIELTNIYDGQIFKSDADFTSSNGSDPAIEGKLINFNLTGGLTSDLSTLAISINGSTKRYATDSARFNFVQSGGVYTGEFDFFNNGDDSLKLVNGPNSIVITATANGIPISTHITVYLFPADVPEVTTIVPVPVGQSTDPDKLYQNTGELQYTTTERTLEVLFSVVNATQVVVSIDGQQHAASTKSGTSFNDVTGKLDYISTTGTGVSNFRLLYTVPGPLDATTLHLPESGTKSITIMAVAGTTTSSKTLQITRVRVPYKILSPKLPEEQVINQNFLNVSIEAEGADQITVNKEQMVKGSDGIFRMQLNNLKNGANKINFTIQIGNTTTDGSFTVTYAAQNQVGAQYKTQFPSSGKVSVFNGALTLSLPKGTMLKQPQAVSQINAPQINLFNSQQILFGIADKLDGRTVKRYNRVGEYENGVPQDGKFADVSMNGYAAGLIQGTRNFGFASQLFWIDAGYYDSTTGKIVNGMHPYTAANNDAFYLRGNNPNRWLVPTNRGTITLSYDPSIRNEAAENLSIWRFTDNAWKNIGGVVNTSKKTVTASFDGFGYYAVMFMRYGFEDVTGHPYARDHVNTVFAKGVMQPRDPNSLFGVYENITRGEFATMIVKILDLPLNYDTTIQQLTFSDVPPNAVPNALWDYRYIETAARAGIISGLSPRQFGPGAYLTREQAAVIIARAMNLKVGTPEKDRTALAKQFTDAGQVEYYAIPSVQAVTKAKIMNGIQNPPQEGQRKPTYSFSPKANLTRADMAIIAYNIMTKLKRI